MNSSCGLGPSSTQLILFFFNSWALHGTQEMKCGVDVQMVRGSSVICEAKDLIFNWLNLLV